MRRGIVALALMFATGAVIAQSQPPATPNTKTSDAPDNVSQEHIYGPKEGAKPPRATYTPDPDYPTKGRNGLTGGTVVLGVVVGREGLPRDVEVVRSLSPGFDQAAINGVKKWRFAPATKDGNPVAVRMNVEVRFVLSAAQHF